MLCQMNWSSVPKKNECFYRSAERLCKQKYNLPAAATVRPALLHHPFLRGVFRYSAFVISYLFSAVGLLLIFLWIFHFLRIWLKNLVDLLLILFAHRASYSKARRYSFHDTIIILNILILLAYGGPIGWLLKHIQIHIFIDVHNFVCFCTFFLRKFV